MSSLEDIKNEAVRISLAHTEKFFKKIEIKKTLEIKSKYPTINTLDCEIEKGERCFVFSVGRILPKGPPVKYQNKSYGLSETFLLEDSQSKIEIPGGAGKISIRNSFEPFGELWELKSENFPNNGHFRAILPLSTFNNKPVEYIESVPFKTLGSIRVAGYIKIPIDDYSIGLFDYEINGKECLIIEGYGEINFQDFKSTVDAIIYSFGLLSGSLIRDEVYYLQYPDTSLNVVNNFYYKRLPGALEGLAAINPIALSRHSELDKNQCNFPKKIFAELVQTCLEDKRLFRAVKIITESANYPPEIKASTFSVALETLRNIIITRTEERVNPFKEKSTASKTIAKLKEVVDGVEDSKFNNKKSVIDRLTQLNQPSNTKSFFKTFELLDIELNEDDKKCLKKRNDFLHGRIPFQHKGEKKGLALHHIVLKLHLLLSALILKYADYDGYLLNNLKVSYQKKVDIQFNEPLFRKI